MTEAFQETDILVSPNREDSDLKPPDTLFTQLKVLMFLRVLMVSVLLGITAYLHSRQVSTFFDPTLISLYVLCGAVYLLTLVYAGFLLKGFNRHLLAYIQLTIDILFIASFIYITNGFDTFAFLFIISIINSAIILGRWGAVLIAVLSSLFFSVLLDLRFFDIIPAIGNRPLSIRDPHELVVNIFYAFLAFIVVALLSGYLADEILRMGRRLEQKQADLEDLEDINRDIVQSLSSGLITLNPFFRVTSFNDSAEQITGLNFSEVYNRPVEQIFPSLKKALQKDIQRGELKYFNDVEGADIDLGFSSSPLRNREGRFLGYVCNFQDVTMVKRLEMQLRESEKLSAIVRLAAGLAHEIRNPLASMSGSIQMLREELKPKGQNRALMDIVNRETERLNHLIKDFLEFAKPKKSQVSRLILNQVISETVEMGRQHAREGRQSGVQMHLEVSQDPLYIQADAGKLKQVLWNLLLNAFHAVSERWKGGAKVGQIHVRLSKNNDQLFFEIEDEGTGIRECDLGLIYEPFFTTKGDGTGMGLATVRRIIDEHQWHIEVDSQWGKGTHFRILFPLENPTQNIEDEASSSHV